MKNKMNKYLMMLLVVGCVLLVSAGTVSAQNYYVSTNGNDGNSGTSMNQAFGTVEHGSSTLHAGDTLFIDGGTYWNDKVSIQNSGTSNNWITVTNYNGEKVKMYHDEEFNNMCLIHLVDKSYIEIENIESSHYGSAMYISGKYRGDTHNIIITNVDSLRSYSRGYACNAGAHDITFKDILIKDVQHPWSAPNSFDFLTSPHDADYKPYTNYMIYNIELINVDLDYNHNHGGFNFGQGVSVGDYSEHWEGKLCDNIYMEGCDAVDIAGAAFYTNKYVLHNSKIIDCSACGGFTGVGVIGNNLEIINLRSYDNDPDGHDLYFLWDEPCNNVLVECFEGRAPYIPKCSQDEVTIIGCNNNDERSIDIEEESEDWKDVWYGEDSAGGKDITTEEMQHASHYWIEDRPLKGHVLTTVELQKIIADWNNYCSK